MGLIIGSQSNGGIFMTRIDLKKLLAAILTTLLLMSLSQQALFAKNSVLVLGVLEENWDNIPMRFGKVRRGTPPLKQEFLQSFNRAQVQFVNYPESVAMFMQDVSDASKLFVVHKIHYLANTDRLTDLDRVNLDIGRSGVFIRTLEKSNLIT